MEENKVLESSPEMPLWRAKPKKTLGLHVEKTTIKEIKPMSVEERLKKQEELAAEASFSRDITSVFQFFTKLQSVVLPASLEPMRNIFHALRMLSRRPTALSTTSTDLLVGERLCFNEQWPHQHIIRFSTAANGYSMQVQLQYESEQLIVTTDLPQSKDCTALAHVMWNQMQEQHEEESVYVEYVMTFIKAALLPMLHRGQG